MQYYMLGLPIFAPSIEFLTSRRSEKFGFGYPEHFLPFPVRTRQTCFFAFESAFWAVCRPTGLTVARTLQVTNKAGAEEPIHPASIHRERNISNLKSIHESLLDYLRWPHLHLFDSLDHLGSLLKEAPLVRTNRLMRYHAHNVLEKNKVLWRSILDVATAQRHSAEKLSVSFADAMETYPEVYRNFLKADSLREACAAT